MKTLSMQNMRNDLWDDFQGVRVGKVDPKVANASANIAGKILTTIRLELLYCQLTGDRPRVKLLANNL